MGTWWDAGEWRNVSQSRTRIAIIGGGPGGYEAALVAAQLGAEVTLVERDGLGGACVLTDCVPSKTLIETSSTVTVLNGAGDLGIRVRGDGGMGPVADPARLYGRIKSLARAQSADVAARVAAEGVDVIEDTGRLSGPHTVQAGGHRITADAVLIAPGAHPRVLPEAVPDGERILNWRQLYDLPDIPEELIVVGSGVTGAEFASAYQALGSQVTLVSSRERVLPHEDIDAAVVIEDVFRRRGMTVLGRSRAASVKRTGDRVVVTLTDGRTVRGSHCLLTVGMEPSVSGLGLEDAGVKLDERGLVAVDRVSRTSAPGVYAAGDCTGKLMLASVAAMQGRIAMWHALGQAVHPIRISHVAATIFTDPEIATVGVSHNAVDSGEVAAAVVKLPLAGNPRAKMAGVRDGFVKLYARPDTSVVLGGVVVGPRASELILPVSIAVEQRLTVDQLAQTFTVYPSLSGSLAEAARKLMSYGELVGRMAQVRVVGDGQVVLAEAGDADVVGVDGHREHAADDGQRRHHDAQPRRTGQRGQGAADGHHHDQVAEHGPAPPARVDQLVPDPVAVGRRQPESDGEPELPADSRVTREPGHGASALNTADHRAGGDRLADLDGQAGHGSVLVRGQRLFHLHRLQDDDRVAHRHGLPVGGDHLDDGALHRAGQLVAATRRRRVLAAADTTPSFG